MPRGRYHYCNLLAMAMLATPAWADSIEASLTLNGVTVDLAAGSIPGLFSEGGSVITADDLVAVHSTLLDAGIETQGYLSIMLAETDRGLALINLFDGSDGSAPGTPPTSVLGCQLIWEGINTTMVNLDAGGSWTVSPAGEYLVGAGAFQWEHGLSYEAMALTELVVGQTAVLQFNDLGMYNMQEQVLQLITFGGSGGWQVADTAGFIDHVIAIDAEIMNVVPAPAALVILALAGLAGPRRRRR